MNQKLKIDMGRVENIVEKGENAGYQYFLLFPQCFQKVSFSGLLKSGLCGKGLNRVFNYYKKRKKILAQDMNLSC